VPDSVPIRWQPAREAKAAPPWPMPPVPVALGRGLCNRCPACGHGTVFRGFLRVVAECPHCGAPLGSLRADDAPPYFTIVITGHLVIPLVVFLGQWGLSFLAQGLILLPLTAAIAIGLMRPVKGATVGVLLGLGLARPPEE
jgi:uncharacterized protein (DUF983 family)